MKRAKRRKVRELQREQVALREELERSFRRELRRDDTLADLVTAEGAAAEPLHRWFTYRQGFSPGLVRRFLQLGDLVEGPVLDPFSGSGTVAVECAREGRPAVGSDVVRSVLRITRARFLAAPGEWPDLALEDDLETLFGTSRDEGQRVAVLLAASQTVDGQGRPKQSGYLPAEHVALALGRMREDLQRPAPCPASVLKADARRLPYAGAVFGGLLTSPPYLSRYDYERVNSAMEALLDGGVKRRRKRQLRAAPSTAGGTTVPAPPEAEEAALQLEEHGEARTAAAVRGYFADMRCFLVEALRVLRPGAPCWIVVGGADMAREYVPADLILARMARESGFELDGLEEARRLRPQGRNLGGLTNVSPRESLLRLRRPRQPG